MSELYNIYCDESCHLESSAITPDNRYMVLGGVICADNLTHDVFNRIKNIKTSNKLNSSSEVKWVKVSKAKLPAYKALIDYFFDNSELSFRALIVDKEQLNHGNFHQSHDEFYYKMYWQTLNWFIDQKYKYHIYLDIKDTQGGKKVQKLKEVLCNANYDFNGKIIDKVQIVRSDEVALLQITDLLLGAVAYAKRFPQGGKSFAKNEIVKLIIERSHRNLQKSSLLSDKKFNLFHWEGRQ